VPAYVRICRLFTTLDRHTFAESVTSGDFGPCNRGRIGGFRTGDYSHQHAKVITQALLVWFRLRWGSGGAKSPL